MAKTSIIINTITSRQLISISILYYLLHSTMHYIVAKLKKNVNAANYFLKNFTYKKYKVKAPSTYGITIR